MAVRIGDTLKQMNDLPFPIAEAKDISLGDSNVETKFNEIDDNIISLDLKRVGDKVYISVNGIIQGNGVAIGDVPPTVLAILDDAILDTAVLG